MAVWSLTEPSLASRQEQVMLLNFYHGHVKSALPSPYPEVSQRPRKLRVLFRRGTERCVTMLHQGRGRANPTPQSRETQREQNESAVTYTSVRGREKSQLSPVLLWQRTIMEQLPSSR